MEGGGEEVRIRRGKERGEEKEEEEGGVREAT